MKKQRAEEAYGGFQNIRGLANEPALTHSYNELLWNVVQNGEMVTAKSIFKEMVDDNVKMDIETYALLIGSCVPDSNANRSLLYLENMAQNNVMPTKIFYETLSQIFKGDDKGKAHAGVWDQCAQKPGQVTKDELLNIVGKLQNLYSDKH